MHYSITFLTIRSLCPAMPLNSFSFPGLNLVWSMFNQQFFNKYILSVLYNTEGRNKESLCFLPQLRYEFLVRTNCTFCLTKISFTDINSILWTYKTWYKCMWTSANLKNKRITFNWLGKTSSLFCSDFQNIIRVQLRY